MADLIERQAAIKAVDDLPNCYNGYSDAYDKAYIIGVLEEVPSAQPDKDALDDAYAHGYTAAESEFRKRMDEQPEIVLCIDCKRYDTHGHRCKFWNHGVTGVDWCSKSEPWRGEES